MKALLDEQLSPRIADLLRSRGLDVVAVAECDALLEASDADVLTFAVGEGRAVVTNNIQDFRPLAAARLAAGESHAGLILVPAKRPRTRAATGSLADAIEAVLTANPDGLAHREEWLPPG